MRSDTPKTVVSRDLWMKAVSETCGSLLDLHPEAVTIQEFSRMLNVSRPVAARMMARLVEAGKVKAVRKRTTCLGGGVGVVRTVTAYLLEDTK